MDVLEEVFAVATDRISLAMLAQVVIECMLAILALWLVAFFIKRTANREV